MTTFVQAVVTGILLGGIYGVVSMGLSLVGGVMRIINFAHGELVMLAMYAAFVMKTALMIDPSITMLMLIPVMFVLGMGVYHLLFKRVVMSGADLLVQMALTVGLSFLLQTVAQVVFSPTPRSIDVSWASKYLHIGGVFISQGKTIAFLVSLAVTVLLWLFLTRTDFGRAMRAMVDDRDVAQMMGISSNRVYTIAMGASFALAGVGGVILMTCYPVTPYVGIQFLPLAFVAVVMGGMGNVLGAFVGGMIVGVVQQVTAVYVAYQLQNAGLLIVFIAILLFRPKGLFGKEGVL